ncbi:MAG: hypothetical protein FD189_40 [Elusimicrobia bacterium]|nr:MAG: hypothetical protein FD154_192 [Elusimicrobiota bacterium]KAF0158398.1 MAG: hypothetical protein FD189_40 [Elusimicrobiota bacterium]
MRINKGTAGIPLKEGLPNGLAASHMRRFFLERTREPALPDRHDCLRPCALCARAEFVPGRVSEEWARKNRTVTSASPFGKPTRRVVNRRDSRTVIN